MSSLQTKMVLKLDENNLEEVVRSQSSPRVDQCFATDVCSKELPSDIITSYLSTRIISDSPFKKILEGNTVIDDSNCLPPNRKRPRIQRPEPQYPNSNRRTSAPAFLWSPTSLFFNQARFFWKSPFFEEFFWFFKIHFPNLFLFFF